MAWVRPKHPKPKVEVDPKEALRPVLEYFSCSRPIGSNSNNKQLSRIPKKPLLLLESYDQRPPKRQFEEPDSYQIVERHRPRSEYHPKSEYHPRSEYRPKVQRYPRAEHHAADLVRVDYRERRSQRSASQYTREISPPPPPPPLTSYNLKARPGAHLRLMPSRHHVASESYSSRRPASRWASATTPLEM